jgi:hypothetical protein
VGAPGRGLRDGGVPGERGAAVHPAAHSGVEHRGAGGGWVKGVVGSGTGMRGRSFSGAVLALLGSEPVEGAADGGGMREVRRASFAPEGVRTTLRD